MQVLSCKVSKLARSGRGVVVQELSCKVLLGYPPVVVLPSCWSYIGVVLKCSGNRCRGVATTGFADYGIRAGGDVTLRSLSSSCVAMRSRNGSCVALLRLMASARIPRHLSLKMYVDAMVQRAFMLNVLLFVFSSVYRSDYLIYDIASLVIAVTARPHHSLSKMYVGEVFQCAFVVAALFTWYCRSCCCCYVFTLWFLTCWHLLSFVAQSFLLFSVVFTFLTYRYSV